ncbi:hypothetical protein ARNL5_03082 [Anaerolineae bacterium]|nr:hypothetical protein [Sandaracinaceae bacterium]CAG0988902.1 hypothetical protein ARNL5_03082 [Anaerolineae bacterium]
MDRIGASDERRRFADQLRAELRAGTLTLDELDHHIVEHAMRLLEGQPPELQDEVRAFVESVFATDPRWLRYRERLRQTVIAGEVLDGE